MEAHRAYRCRRPARKLRPAVVVAGRRVMSSRALWTAFVLCLLMCLVTVPVGAHFLLNLNVRILHVEHLADGLRVYLRTPMPYLVADRIGPVGDAGD